jgi:hypothetical protein
MRFVRKDILWGLGLVIGVIIFFVVSSNIRHQKIFSVYGDNMISQFEQDTAKKISKLHPDMDKSLVEDYSRLIYKYCDADSTIGVAIFHTESDFNSFAKSNSKDFGLGQINCPVWNKFFNIKDCTELVNPILNIQITCKLLKMVHAVSDANDVQWWSRYHSFNSIPREVYAQKVQKVLDKLNSEAEVALKSN